MNMNGANPSVGCCDINAVHLCKWISSHFCFSVEIFCSKIAIYSCKLFPRKISSIFFDKTNFEMKIYFSSDDGLIMHADKKDAANSSDDKNEICVF